MAYATPTLTDKNTISEILLDLIRVAVGATNTALAGVATQATLLNLLNLQYAPKGNELRGVTAALTTTTAATLIPTASVTEKIYITSLLVTNSHATQGTVVQILDTIDNTVVWSGYAAPAGGGFAITFPVPLKAGSADYSVEAKCLTAGASVIVSAVGFKTT